jgi:hypothetical protein
VFGKNLYNNFIDSGDNSSVAVLPVLNINLTVLFSSNSIDAIDVIGILQFIRESLAYKHGINCELLFFLLMLIIL